MLHSRILTSFFSVSEVRRHRDQPLLPDAHALQTLIQPINHLVRPQNCILNVLVVVSVGEEVQLNLLLNVSKELSMVTHEEKSTVPSSRVQL